MHPKTKDLLYRLDYSKLLKRVKQTGRINRPEVQRDLAIIRGFRDFEFFAQWFFPDRCKIPFSKMHQDFFDAEKRPEQRGRREAIAAPRGHAKTTMKLILKVLHAILYETDPYILIICQSETEAKDRVTQIANELANNPRILAILGQMAPTPLRSGQKKSFVSANGIKVQAKSIGQQIRGLNYRGNRPTLVILDDVETLASSQSLLQRDKLLDWFDKDVMKLGQTDGSTNFLVIGTCLHVDSLLNQLLERPGWIGRRYQAVIQWSANEALWQTWQGLYTDLANPEREQDSERFFTQHQVELLDGTEVLWPEGDSYLTLMKQRVTDGKASFETEKQNNPLNPDHFIFDMENARMFSIDHAYQTIYWDDPAQTITRYGDLKRIIAFHDPALGSKPGSTSDYGAIVVVGEDQVGHKFVLDCYIQQSSPSAQIEAALRLHQKWNFKALFVEENGFQTLLNEAYQRYQQENQVRPTLLVQGVNNHTNKQSRITSLEPLISNGHLLFSKDLAPEFLKQMRLYPTTHDDGPDALQGAIAQFENVQQRPRTFHGHRSRRPR